MKESVVQEIGSATDKVMSQKASTDILAKKDSNEQLRAGKISASHSTGDSVIWLGDPKEGYDLVYVRSSKRGFIRNNRLSVATYFPDKDGTFALLSDIPKMIADANGFFKRASPIVKIHPDGSFETNEESEGARVQRTGIGSYFISGVMGYNADGAWGVNGGISIPKDINGLELIYVRDKILSNGDIEIQTFHRQHTHLPKDFQNWRIKEIIDGKPVYYADGEQVDIPPSTWLDVRVQMPVDSIWGQQQRLKAK